MHALSTDEGFWIAVPKERPKTGGGGVLCICYPNRELAERGIDHRTSGGRKEWRLIEASTWSEHDLTAPHRVGEELKP